MKQILFGDIKPQGRLRESIQKDMDGCIGHLEELAPSIICEQKIYGENRLTAGSEQAELGRKTDEHQGRIDVPAQYMWWNSESQSNWRDGYCRAALLLEDESCCEQVEEYIADILGTQDTDGYLGIYKEDLRYQHKEENGELWAKATLYRVLLAYYEKTGSGRVRTALERAFAELMKGYPMGASEPFRVKNSFSGHCHGLMITDALYEMYLLTDEKKYLDYAIWLYENFSENVVAEEDLQINNIRDMEYFWKNHGVHLYEHMRSVIVAGLHREEYRPLIDLMLAKLPYYLTPSGGPVGDEGIDRRVADASDTAYEFCSVTELFDSYALLLRETGKLHWADKMEWLYFNAGMGMKHPEESSIMYCKTDNCYTADRRKCESAPFMDERYKYSPVHQTTAVCCVPNMGRLTPHYVQNMFIREGKEITAVLFGDCELVTTVDHTSVSIRQITGYPAERKIVFEIMAEAPVIFQLSIRVPDWADSVVLDGEKKDIRGRKIEILKEWKSRQVIEIEFLCRVKFSTDFRDDFFVSHGPLVYALPIAAREQTILEYKQKPFRETVYTSMEREKENLGIQEEEKKLFRYMEKEEKDWKKQELAGRFRNGKESIPLTMIPMGGTILRKVTFKKYSGGKKMTPFERLKFRLEGKEVDKIPNLNIAMALVAKEAGTDYSTYAQDYRKLVDGNLYCVEKYGFDAVSAISDPMREAAAFGSKIVFPQNGVPYCAEPLLKDGYEIEKLKIVSPYDNERTLDRIKAIEEFRKRVGGEIPIIGWVEGVLAECADLRGVSSLMMDLAGEEELDEVMEIIFRQQCKFIAAQVKAGADIIGVGNAVASLIGPSMYEEFAFQYDKATIKYIHELGAKAKLHICGNITPLLPQLKMLEADILDFDWMVDCRKIREITEGSTVCFCGNIDPVAVMLEGTADEVEEKTKKCITEGGERYIAACGCEVPADTPMNNLIAMNEALYR